MSLRAGPVPPATLGCFACLQDVWTVRAGFAKFGLTTSLISERHVRGRRLWIVRCTSVPSFGDGTGLAQACPDGGGLGANDAEDFVSFGFHPGLRARFEVQAEERLRVRR